MLTQLPPGLTEINQTPIFTQDTVPPALLQSHRTKAGIWAKITVLQGTLEYQILEPTKETHQLTADHPGYIEPTIPHQVKPQGDVQFQVTFYK